MKKSLRLSPAVFVRSLLGGALFVGGCPLLWAAAAPAKVEPVPKAIAFRMHISGFGSSPKSTINTGLARSEHEWTYEETLEGWFEVEVGRRRSGISEEDLKVMEAAMKAMKVTMPSGMEMKAGFIETTEFGVKRGGRHHIVGSVIQRARNYERWFGEGFGPTIYADYTASEEAKWQGTVEPRGFRIELDETSKVWLTMLEPKGWIGDYGSRMNYHGEARFEPSSPAAGFGKPWAYATNDPARKLAGEEKQIETGYNRNTMSSAAIRFPDSVRNNVPAKFEGTLATGKVDYEVARPADVTGTWKMHYSIEWTARTELPEDLRLEIEETPAYREWRPETTADAQPGKALEVTARVVTASGAAPRVAVKSFEWELVQTSREPGVAMNYPVSATDRRLDLELDAAGEFFVRENENQRIVRAVRSGFSDTVKVVPYDWGGWSTLQVTAILTNERRLVGKLRGTAETGLRLPKRAPGSKIADAWKASTQASGADGADDENAPVGSGVKGDGLTLYEEYRGFYERGEHLSGDPKVKDLFVRLEGTEFAAPAAEHFAAVTGLKVRHGLTAEEFPASRIINANHRQGPHLVSQHGIVVRINPALADRFTTVGGPGRPGRIRAVELCPGADTVGNPERVKTKIAHELGHCVNIAHHGEADPRVIWFVKDERLYETNPRSRATGEIYIVDETITDHTPAVIAALKLRPGSRAAPWIGQPQGQHSGDEACFMRYDCAVAYVSPFARNNRITLYDPENYGLGLCTSPTGTGVNDKDRDTPLARYGDAAGGRGDCLHQIHVTDAVQAPNRTGPVKP